MDCESDRTAIGQAHGALDQSLAEGATADDESAVPILDRAADDFAGARTGLVHEHDQPPFLEAAFSVGEAVLAGEGASVGVDD